MNVWKFTETLMFMGVPVKFGENWRCIYEILETFFSTLIQQILP